jgi:hypothetical protein
MFCMPHCFIWFSLFWTHIVLWHIPRLQFLIDPMPEIFFCLSLLMVEQEIEAWVLSISVTLPEFMLLKSGIFLMIPTVDDGWEISLWTSFRVEVMWPLTLPPQHNIWKWPAPHQIKCTAWLTKSQRRQTQDFWQQGKTADCRLCGKCWKKKPAVPRTYLAFQLFSYVLLSSHSLSSCLACCSSWTVLGQLYMTEQPFCLEISRREVSCWQR